jgi:NAD+ kinase
MKVALIGNTYQAEKSRYLVTIIEELLKHGAEIIVERQFLTFITSTLGFEQKGVVAFDERNFSADLCISIGGDGTFLKAASYVEAKEIPILGINTGHLGFLADVLPDEIEEACERICKGDYIVEHRGVVEVRRNGALLSHHPYALNEVALLKHDNSSLIGIEAKIDGGLLNHYMADGLIVTTPTGSTGYSLSVGGPILTPMSGTLCISPVASHSLNTRPVVVTDNVEIELTVESRSHNFLLAIDGRSESLPCTDIITVTKAPFKIGVAKIKRTSFYDTLREKMAWGRRG